MSVVFVAVHTFVPSDELVESQTEQVSASIVASHLVHSESAQRWKFGSSAWHYLSVGSVDRRHTIAYRQFFIARRKCTLCCPGAHDVVLINGALSIDVDTRVWGTVVATC